MAGSLVVAAGRGCQHRTFSPRHQASVRQVNLVLVLVGRAEDLQPAKEIGLKVLKRQSELMVQAPWKPVGLPFAGLQQAG